MWLPGRTVLAGRPTCACRDPRCANAWGGDSDGIALRPNLTGERSSRFAKRERRSDSGGWSPRPLPMLRARTLRPVDVLRPQPFPLRPRGRQVSDKALDLVGAGSLPLASQGLARGEPATLQRPPRFARERGDRPLSPTSHLPTQGIDWRKPGAQRLLYADHPAAMWLTQAYGQSPRFSCRYAPFRTVRAPS